jgi:probable HAF family extracellular repeat protein
MLLRKIACGILSVGLLACPMVAHAQLTYRLVDLTLSGGTAYSYGCLLNSGATLGCLNASGQVTGFAQTSTGAEHAFLWNRNTMLDLGTLGGNTSIGYAVNANGQVAGSSSTASGNLNAFLWTGSTMLDLGTLGGTYSEGFDINTSGMVGGSASLTGDANRHAFLWNGTSILDLGTLGGPDSGVNRINTSGSATGSSELTTAGGPSHAFLWNGSTMVDLGSLGGDSDGLGINDSGQVTGWSLNACGSQHAFLWNGSTMLDLGTLSLGDNSPTCDRSSGIGINASGQVTGSSTDYSSGLTHAFLWTGGTMLDLGTLGGLYSKAIAIDASGQVTGWATTTQFDANGPGGQVQDAFLWNGSTMLDLNPAVAPTDALQPYVHLTIGVAINDLGQIVAKGIDSRTPGVDHLYLVSPSTLYPIVNAGGPYSGYIGSAIALNGASASDPNNNSLTYAWSVNSTACIFSNAAVLGPTLTCTAVGAFTATLQVSNGIVVPAVSSSTTVNVATAGVPCPPSGKVNVRFHYSANGSSGSWSGTTSTSCKDGSVMIGPQAMEGDLKLIPGTTLKAGYDFALPGNKASFTGTVMNPSVVFTLQCVSGAAASPSTLTVAMATGSYPVTGSSWTPSGDQSSPLVYQGSTTVPSACNGGLVRFNQGGSFSAKILLR